MTNADKCTKKEIVEIEYGIMIMYENFVPTILM